MIIDANKGMIPVFSRQCGKPGMQLEIIKAWIESYITKKPVEIKFGMVEVNINDILKED